MQDRVQSKSGKRGKTVVFRLGPGVDLMEGLTRVCLEHGIKSGVVNSCVGSLNGCKLFTPVILPDSKFGAGYGDPIVREGPIELLSVNGMVCFLEDGRLAPHLHFVVSDERGNTFGGHLANEGNRCLITVEGSITEFEGVSCVRRYDEETELVMLSPE
ncbi:MAG: DNA-binding protein [Firmicutes bacterium]|nr:DNA-binding protein [Bacillota bacterium]